MALVGVFYVIVSQWTGALSPQLETVIKVEEILTLKRLMMIAVIERTGGCNCLIISSKSRS